MTLAQLSLFNAEQKNLEQGMWFELLNISPVAYLQ